MRRSELGPESKAEQIKSGFERARYIPFSRVRIHSCIRSEADAGEKGEGEAQTCFGVLALFGSEIPMAPLMTYVTTSPCFFPVRSDDWQLKSI